MRRGHTMIKMQLCLELMLKLALRTVLGIPCNLIGFYGLIFKKNTLVKYRWLGHYLSGFGRDLKLPNWLLKQSDILTQEDYIQRMDKKVISSTSIYTDTSIFYCIGYFTCCYDYTTRKLCSIDRYDFHKDNYYNYAKIDLVLNNQFEVLWLYLQNYFQLRNMTNYIEITSDEDRLRQSGADVIWHLHISDQIFEWLGGTEFNTIIKYQYS